MRRREQHHGQLLQFVQHGDGIAAVDMPERIEPRRAAFRIQRIEQDHVLAIAADIELIPISKLNDAFQALRANVVHKRFVIDISTLET